MFKINTVKRTFIRQATEDSCGTACLAMLLIYAGRKADAMAINNTPVPVGGLSLRELKLLADSFGLTGRCVEMEMGLLKNLNTPVILHTLNEIGQYHFQICYGCDKKRNGNKFLMADPAIQVHYIDEGELSKIWVSKSALFFDSLTFSSKANRKPSLFELLRQRSYPAGLLIVVPMLSMCIASFGIALTWLLQKGLTDSSIFNGHVIYYLVVLLFIICIFRNLFSFLRQYILIQINMSTNRMLMDQLISRIMLYGRRKQRDISNEIKAGFIDLQKIQNAVSAFISIVLSDGFMMAILLVSSFYILPVSGIINLIYLLITIFLEIKTLPELIYQAGKAKVLSVASEKALIDHIHLNDDLAVDDDKKSDFRLFYNRNLKIAQKLAIRLSGRYLLVECLGTINLISVIALCLFRFEAQRIDYESLMLVVIEAYLITALMQKICTSFQQIAEGADAVIAHAMK